MAGENRMDADQKMELFEQMSGKRLVAVTGVLDCVQLQFDPPATINAFTRMSVRQNGTSTTGHDRDHFRNLLCAQIGKEVGVVLVRDAQSFDLGLDDRSRISISLIPDDNFGPEAVTVTADGYLRLSELVGQPLCSPVLPLRLWDSISRKHLFATLTGSGGQLRTHESCATFIRRSISGLSE